MKCQNVGKSVWEMFYKEGQNIWDILVRNAKYKHNFLVFQENFPGYFLDSTFSYIRKEKTKDFKWLSSELASNVLKHCNVFD